MLNWIGWEEGILKGGEGQRFDRAVWTDNEDYSCCQRLVLMSYVENLGQMNRYALKYNMQVRE